MQEVSYDLNNARYQEALRQAKANVQLDDIEQKRKEVELHTNLSQRIKKIGAIYDRGRKV